MVAVAAVVLAGAGVAAAGLIKSPAQAAADAGAPAQGALTAPVDHRVLTSSVITRGKVVADQSVAVTPRVAGGDGAAAAMLTKLSVAPGDRLKAGQVLMEVSGRPVFVWKGQVAGYRDLRPGAVGDDVSQLQRSLRELGHATGADRDGTFGAGTKTALTAFYGSIGYDPLPAQSDNGDAVTAARDGVTGAERALEDARDALAAAGSGSSGDSAADSSGDSTAGKSGGASDTAQLQKAVDRANEDLAAARTVLAEAEVAAGPMLPVSEVIYLRDFPARVDSVPAKVGTEISGTAMTLSAGRLVVHAYLQENQKGMVRQGQKVEIYSEVRGITAHAKVTSVAADPTVPVQQDSDGGGNTTDGSGDTSGYLLEVTPDKALDSQLTGQDVRLTIQAASTDGKALVVPVTAVSAATDGRTVVTVARNGGSTRTRVEVRIGTAGDGFVAVTPVKAGALRTGDLVVTGVRRGNAQ
ncbi:peptidoglycan-binding protein [Streptomyces sp. NBC_01744]|uniref:peptidoglycan-binding protein n=1 Tax=Streptomyces sp. NBC_01744 TaxID=2975927 RepID=UPI003D9A6334|nr:peptidoglycan-binding protein [Streptomyces sp. NBC_01744]